MTRALPFAKLCRSGLLDHYTHWDLAATILGGGRGTRTPLKVSIQKMLHRQVLLDQDIVLGDDASVATAVCEFTNVVAEADSRASAASVGVDWDSDLLPKTRGARPRRTSMPVESTIDIGGEVIQCLDVKDRALFEEDSDGIHESGGDSSGGSESGSDQDQPADLAPIVDVAALTDEPNLTNCLRMFARFPDTDAVFAAYTDFKMTRQWAIERRPFGQANEVARIKCMGGVSLFVRCGYHQPFLKGKKKVPCKCIITISGDFARAQVLAVLWLMAGISKDVSGHEADVQEAYQAWADKS